jgi:hypothetical protein
VLRPNVQRLRADELEVNGDPEIRELLKNWEFLSIGPHCPPGEWPASGRELARIMELAVSRLLEPGMVAWLGLYGPFESDAILGAANSLLGEKNHGRFYLPSVECLLVGPGYVETYFGVEWRPGALLQLFDHPLRPLPCTCHSSIIICKESSLPAISQSAAFYASVRHNGPNIGLATCLRESSYLFLPDLDFDGFYVGALSDRLEYAKKALEAPMPEDGSSS